MGTGVVARFVHHGLGLAQVNVVDGLRLGRGVWNCCKKEGESERGEKGSVIMVMIVIVCCYGYVALSLMYCRIINLFLIINTLL